MIFHPCIIICRGPNPCSQLPKREGGRRKGGREGEEMEKKGWCWVERGGERGKRKKRGERSVQRQGEDVDRLGGGGIR